MENLCSDDKQLQKPFNVARRHDVMPPGILKIPSRTGPSAFFFFNRAGCCSQQAEQCFLASFFFLFSHLLLSASTVMCPIIPLHEQFLKSSGGGNRHGFLFFFSFFLTSGELVPSFETWCTHLICNAKFREVLLCDLFLLSTTLKKERNYRQKDSLISLLGRLHLQSIYLQVSVVLNADMM